MMDVPVLHARPIHPGSSMFHAADTWLYVSCSIGTRRPDSRTQLSFAAIQFHCIPAIAVSLLVAGAWKRELGHLL